MKSPEKAGPGEYGRLTHLLKTGFIKEIEEIFPDRERKALLTELKMSYKTLNRRMVKPGGWKMEEVFTIAEVLQVDHNVISDLIYKARQARKKKGKK